MRSTDDWSLRPLDLLRGLLCLQMLIGHARWLLWSPWHEWIQQTHPLPAKMIAAGNAVFSSGTEAVMLGCSPSRAAFPTRTHQTLILLHASLQNQPPCMSSKKTNRTSRN